jgi:hypothetical protein
MEENSQIVTLARYAESTGRATTAVSAQVAAECIGNSATATRLKEARKIIFNHDAETEVVFDGSADLIVSLKNKKAEKSECDSLGNNIVETYATKSELQNYPKNAEVADEYISKNDAAETYISKSEVEENYTKKNKLADYVAKSDFKFSFEQVENVPYLCIEVGGKKYRFSGAEV